MPILVTSASGINGNGYGALLAFKRDGTLIGPFNDDSRIVDPPGLAVDQKEGLLFLNSGGDRYWHSVQAELSFATQARSQD
jgi:hypothetical protein